MQPSEGSPISQAPATPAPKAPANTAANTPAKAPPSAGGAKIRRRHSNILLSFLLIVVAPLVAAVFYLFVVAEDQYASEFGFAVRSEELDSAQSLLGGLASLSGTSSSDTDILYEFIQSRTLVDRLNARLDLVALYSKPDNDPVFAFDRDSSLEDLVTYWQSMVVLSYASGSGLLQVRVNAFTPDDALLIAEAIIEESSAMINRLSTIARADATGYAEEDLEQAVTRLKTAREALTRFRSETRIVDPSADIQGQMGLLNSLETQLAAAIIEMNLLMETARQDDPRVETARRRITVIESLIEAERQKFGLGGHARISGEKDYSTLVGEFERLMVDLEYAEKSYLAAQTVLDTAQAESLRKSRYLATYAEPARPTSAQYPRRINLSLITAAFLLLGWLVGLLVYYSLRDRS